MSGSFQEVREDLTSLIDHLERVQEELDIMPETAYGRLREEIENLNGKLDLMQEDTIARIERMEAAVMAKLDQLGPFYYPITATWPVKKTAPQQPWYEPPYKITYGTPLTNGMTYGSNSAEIGEMAEPLRIYRRTRSCRR